MKRILGCFLVLLWLLVPPAWATKTIGGLTADTSPTSDDLIETENNPGGSPASRKVTLENLFTHASDITASSITTAGNGIFSGNVGIGTAVPGNLVDIAGGVAIGAVANVLAPANGLYVSGNVGIGSTVPGYTLDVGGVVRAQQVITGAGSGQAVLYGNNGNVGIGTAAPRALVQVVGGDVKVGTGTFNNTSAADDLYITGNLEVDGTIYGDAGGLSNLPAAAGWTDAGTNVYTTTLTDNVGIGTVNPSSQFELVHQGSQSLFRISSVATGAGDLFIIRSTGNVGIGTINPGAMFGVGIGKLTVDSSGNVSTSGTVSSTSPTDTNFTKNVGIGTVNPQGVLAVVKSGSLAPLLISSASSAAGDFLIVTSTGNIGIGTVQPLGKLDIRGTMNWAVKNSANQACNTTCGTSGCVFGEDTGALGNWLACTDATADSCLCTAP